MRKFLSALLLCALLLTLSAPTLAATYADLPNSHWAYAVMTEAAEKGVLTGGDDGAMHPGQTLTWGQTLIMLGRAFYPHTLTQNPVVEGNHWATGAYDAAHILGVLEQADFLPVSPLTLDAPITRRDAAVAVGRTITRVLHAEGNLGDLPTLFPDFYTLPEPYRAGVLQCAALGIINGKENGNFAGSDTLTRAEGAAILMRVLALAEQIKNTPATPTPPPSSTPTQPPVTGGTSFGGALAALGSNDEKLMLLYGTTERNRYASKEEADAHMTTVTVPVWRLNRTTGVKTPSQLSFPIHAAIAEDMVAVFTEIFNDPEQFPIYSIGGYQWRGTSGEHNCGTALDINYIENYQIYPDGRITAGECWLPGENPFSIPENGSVVRIFNAHGYSWGGNAWPSTSNKDYMHFSYLGR